MIEAHFREELGDSDRRFGKRLLPTIWREDGKPFNDTDRPDFANEKSCPGIRQP
jgi:hypothetical protein